jgi:hypothetical protein
MAIAQAACLRTYEAQRTPTAMGEGHDFAISVLVAGRKIMRQIKALTSTFANRAKVSYNICQTIGYFDGSYDPFLQFNSIG